MNVEKNRFPRRGEVWIVDYNFKFANLQSEEQDFTIESQIKKNRPCVIISNNIHNELSDLIFIVPLTSDDTSRLKSFEVLVEADKLNNLDKDSKALITRLSHFSKDYRLKKFIGSVKEEIMEKIVKKVNNLISLDT